MRLEVLGDDSISAQARTYAEYRLFAGLSQAADTQQVTHARLVLRRTAPSRTSGGVSCTVTVDIEGRGSVCVEAVEDHPYAAVNRAVDRLSEGRWRPTTGDVSPPAHAAAD